MNDKIAAYPNMREDVLARTVGFYIGGEMMRPKKMFGLKSGQAPEVLRPLECSKARPPLCAWAQEPRCYSTEATDRSPCGRHHSHTSVDQVQCCYISSTTPSLGASDEEFNPSFGAQRDPGWSDKFICIGWKKQSSLVEVEVQERTGSQILPTHCHQVKNGTDESLYPV